VANYVSALEYGLERLKTLPLSLRLVRELHERLMAARAAATPRQVSSGVRRTGLANRAARSIRPPTFRHRRTRWASNWPVGTLPP